jgi:succinyl-CoA synthetase beta subunit
LLSAQGGVEIESVAASAPEAIAKVWVDPTVGITPDETRQWVEAAGLNPSATGGAVQILQTLYRCFVDGDCGLAEINPLILTPAGEVKALDAKVSLDDNAAFRHPEWEAFAGTADLDEREWLAKEKGLQYVGLDGSVGIIANGAGLAMSTVDVVSQVGGTPANFLDIGGGANADMMAAALEVIESDDNVRAILINIFGGITRGEDVANGIVQALGRFTPRSPIVVRLDGTNAEEGRLILEPHLSDRLISRPTMLDAAREAVALASA